MDLVELMTMLGIKKLTERQARAICNTVDEKELTDVDGWSTARRDAPIVLALRAKFPQFKWRIAQCHDRRRTYFALTIDSPDPREYEEMAKRGGWDDEGVYSLFSERKASSS